MDLKFGWPITNDAFIPELNGGLNSRILACEVDTHMSPAESNSALVPEPLKLVPWVAEPTRANEGVELVNGGEYSRSLSCVPTHKFPEESKLKWNAGLIEPMVRDAA